MFIFLSALTYFQPVGVSAFLFYDLNATKANNSLVDIQMNNGMRARAFKEPHRNTSLNNYLKSLLSPVPKDKFMVDSHNFVLYL